MHLTGSALLLLLHAGVLKVQGLMPARCSMFDTPGVRHGHQLTSRLGSEEARPLIMTSCS